MNSEQKREVRHTDKFKIPITSVGGVSEFYEWEFECRATGERLTLRLDGPEMTRRYVARTLRKFADELEKGEKNETPDL